VHSIQTYETSFVDCTTQRRMSLMLVNALIILFLPVILVLVEVGIVTLLDRKKPLKEWSSIRYGGFILAPLITILILTVREGWGILLLYFLSCIIGSITETFAGWSFHRLEHRHLWKYQLGTGRGFSSIYIFPIWGLVGVLFFLVGQLLTQYVPIG
jgi:hypothetical protein